MVMTAVQHVKVLIATDVQKIKNKYKHRKENYVTPVRCSAFLGLRAN